MKVSDYNQKLYEQVLEKVNSGYHQIFYSEATGLGKSIIMQLLIINNFQDKRILYITPKNSIWDNLSQYEAMKNVACKMYAAFKNNQTSLEIINDYDVVFIDECHHMYSDIQGESIQYAMSHFADKYFFGFTATPKLKVGLASEAFETSCIGMDVYEAVQNGIFPKIKYAVLVPDEKGSIYSNDILDQIYEIFSKRQEEGDKCLVYLTNIQDLEEYQCLLKGIYKDYEIMSIHSQKSLKENKEILERFNNASGNVMLLSVDSLMEGVHLENVHCLISCRHTQSLNVFLQIMGRLCKPYSTIEPLFIDVTDSIEDIDFNLEDVSTRKGQGTSIIGVRSLKDIMDVHCDEYKYVEFYEKLKQVNKQVQCYKDFTWSSIPQLAKQLGVTASAINSWLRRNIGSTVQDYIDLKLNAEIKYRGVDCSSYESIAVSLHKTIHDVKLVMKLNDMTRQDYVDFVLGNESLEIYNNKLNIVIYRGIDCYNAEAIANCLQKEPSEVRKGIKKSGDAYKYIDDVLGDLDLQQYIQKLNVSKRFCYRGIKYDSVEDICMQLGVTVKTYNDFMRRAKAQSAREFIDAYLNAKKG